MERHPVFSGRLTIVKRSNSPNLSIKFNAIPVKIPTAFFMKMDELILKFIRNCKGFCLAIIIMKKNKVGGHISGFKTYY